MAGVCFGEGSCWGSFWGGRGPAAGRGVSLGNVVAGGSLWVKEES